MPRKLRGQDFGELCQWRRAAEEDRRGDVRNRLGTGGRAQQFETLGGAEQFGTAIRVQLGRTGDRTDLAATLLRVRRTGQVESPAGSDGQRREQI